MLPSLHKPISPPPARPAGAALSSLAALEAGKDTVTDPVQAISTHLRKYTTRPQLMHLNQLNNLSIDAWKALYSRHAHSHGHHFVIHQHDHPVAGLHYDLRLQCSDSSSLSWSIMYGLPGDPNSRRLTRNATETRVHLLWNHLIETASAKTGSMLIWDTGEYEILPDKSNRSGRLNTGPETDESASDSDSDSRRDRSSELPESEKLRSAFQNHKIHLRLHGTRLPKNYTIFLSLDKSDRRCAPTPESLSRTPRKRKRRRTITNNQPSSTSNSESDSESDAGISSGQTSGSGKRRKKDNNTEHSDADADAEGNSETDYQIRLHNAYPGADNDIGSIHQRRWFLVLDRAGSGFVPENHSAGKRWVRGVDQQSRVTTGFDPFYVRGPEVERSVLTGRLGRDVLRDEGVEGFVPRRGWNAVLV